MSSRNIIRTIGLAVWAFCLSGVLGVRSTGGAQPAQARVRENTPYLHPQGTATQLVVDGKPYLILGAELNNSSASSLDYMKPLWPRLAATHINTVLATVSWELLEPQEGRFDFSLVDGLLKEARANKLHLVLLWFGSWKNGKSTYQPLWVKTKQERFPLARSQDGRSMPILTTFSDANRDADAHAFAALMRHIRQVDGRQHTVLMMQVENEVGVLGDSRDYCPAANKAFAEPVPKELMDHLQQHKDRLIAEFSEVWAANGSKTSGTWTEVFGPGKPGSATVPPGAASPPLTAEEQEAGWRRLQWPADEIFMAWHYARYVNAVAEAGKAEYDIPMCVNAWLQQRDCAWPGAYPSGGPLPQVINVWHAGAPAVDLLSPDIYVAEFEEVCARFNRCGNPLFIPESRADATGLANALWAFGEQDAIGYSPFGIDRFAGPDTELARAYDVLSQVAPLILDNQGKSMMTAVLLDKENPTQKLHLGNYFIEARSTSGSSGPRADAPPERAAGLFVSTGPDDYVIVGRGMTVYFSCAVNDSLAVGLGTVEEGRYVNGRWVAGRRLNGDETPEWKALRFPGERYTIQRVTLYRYH